MVLVVGFAKLNPTRPPLEQNVCGSITQARNDLVPSKKQTSIAEPDSWTLEL